MWDGRLSTAMRLANPCNSWHRARLPSPAGVFSFVDSMVLGMRSLNWSAEIYAEENGEEEEPSAFEKWLDEKLGEKAEKVVMGVVMAFSFVLAICIFAPLVEELVFRGAILRALLDTRMSRWVAIAISAAIFALAHFNPAQMPHALCMGLLLGWMYERTMSIIPGIMLHWVNNTVAFVVFRLFPQYSDAKLVDLLGGDHLKVAMALLFSLLILLPAIFQLHLRMKRAE